jgi:S-adenosylmethionine:tRNA ribosyltransferase-isomerase
MHLRDFDYELPPDRVAERPARPRDASRLLVVRRGDAPLEDRTFRDLPDLLDAGDLLVVNDTRVIPARLLGRRADTGGRVEVFLLRPVAPLRWRVLLDPARRLRVGTRVVLADGCACVVEAVEDGGERTVRFEGTDDVAALAERIGTTPLPPYIRRPADATDRASYQTVYARAPGAVAAPTAGLHFTPALLGRLRARGVRVASVTLHVGPGTFRPVLVDDVDAHRMDAEPYDVPPSAAVAVAEARAAGRRVVAVGTTSVRTLEAATAPDGSLRAGPGATDLFIRPGFPFRAVTALVTNFHLPRSTLLLLVCAFGGRERVLSAYRHALDRGYRFYSYGDAMLLL